MTNLAVFEFFEFLIKGLKVIMTSAEAGGVVFYGVIDFSAPSFPDLAMGETAACPLSFSGWECGGGKGPPWISPKKRPALKSQTEENATPPSPYD